MRSDTTRQSITTRGWRVGAEDTARYHHMPAVSLSLSLSVKVRHRIKRAVFGLLPQAWQEAIDRRYYYLRLARGALSSEAELSLLPLLVREGETVVDVGANLGGYAIALSKLVGRSGTVHCLEPVPRTFRLLEYNVRRLAPYSNVRLHELAASDRIGAADIHLPLEGELENFYTASLLPGSEQPHRAVRIDTTTLDALLGDEVVSLLKIDTEGAEWNVLRGSERVLALSRPAIVCEVATGISRFGHEADDVFELLRPFGYLAFRFVAGTLVEVTEPDERRMPNYVFLGSERLLSLALSRGPVPAIKRISRAAGVRPRPAGS